MAYNEISDARVQNGAIANSALFFDLRDNPKAIAAGDPGAPRIAHGAIAGPGAGDVIQPCYVDGTIHPANCTRVINSGSGYQAYDLLVSSVAYVSGIRVQRDGNLRVQITGLNGDAGTSYIRLYRNGVAYGTERTITSTTAQSFTEDLEFFSGDEIQLFCNRNGESVVATLSIRGGHYDAGLLETY